MNTRIILSIIIVSLGSIAAILPKKNTSSIQLNAKELHREIILATYLVDADELADRLINEDPAIQLIDVRTEEEYEKYHLPGAINIPLPKILDEKWLPYIDQDSKENIFYSNGATLSSEAGILARQLGYKNNYVLDGGLNKWFSTIIRPEIPSQSDPKESWETYNFRLAASQYFTGGNAINNVTAQAALPLVPRKTKTRVQGGCN